MSAAEPSTSTTRRRVVLASVGAIAAAAGGGLAWWRLRPRGGQDDPVPDDFWTRSFPTPADGATFRMAEMKGRMLLVNFWATWCPPCVEEMPLLDRFYRQHRPNGWQIVGIAVDQAPAVRQFLARTPVSFPIAMAGMEGTAIGRELGNQVGGLPFTVLIGPDSRVRQRQLGQLTQDELDRWRAAAAG